MPTDEQYEELRRLIAALTERVYRLEQMAGTQHGRAAFQARHVEPAAKTESDTQAELESKIGVSYFLKYAFDNQWIGPAGRVLIGLLGGMAVVFWSEQVRRCGYAIFSYSLKAIGIGVLYLSLWACSQLYNLIPNPLAFLSMAAITAVTVGLALWQDAEIIAVFATLGAFITPIALSTGVNNAIGLFAYLVILDLGTLILIRYRPWPGVLIGRKDAKTVLIDA